MCEKSILSIKIWKFLKQFVDDPWYIFYILFDYFNATYILLIHIFLKIRLRCMRNGNFIAVHLHCTRSLLVEFLQHTRCEGELLVHTCASTCILRIRNVDSDMDPTTYHRLCGVSFLRILYVKKNKNESVLQNLYIWTLKTKIKFCNNL